MRRVTLMGEGLGMYVWTSISFLGLPLKKYHSRVA